MPRAAAWRLLTATPRPAHLSETQAIYRSLLVRQIGPRDAAYLTALLCQIRVGPQASWTADDVARLLFLRELRDAGQFRPTPGE